MQIEERDRQLANAESPIDKSRQPDSNVTIESRGQSEKQSRPSVLTENGMQTEESDGEPMNAWSWISESFESEVNAIVERYAHLEKR
jgi:hypothetical protein